MSDSPKPLSAYFDGVTSITGGASWKAFNENVLVHLLPFELLQEKTIHGSWVTRSFAIPSHVLMKEGWSASKIKSFLSDYSNVAMLEVTHQSITNSVLIRISYEEQKPSTLTITDPMEWNGHAFTEIDFSECHHKPRPFELTTDAHENIREALLHLECLGAFKLSTRIEASNDGKNWIAAADTTQFITSKEVKKGEPLIRECKWSPALQMYFSRVKCSFYHEFVGSVRLQGHWTALKTLAPLWSPPTVAPTYTPAVTNPALPGPKVVVKTETYEPKTIPEFGKRKLKLDE